MQGVWDLGVERALLETFNSLLHLSASGSDAFNYLILQTCRCGYMCNKLALPCLLQPRGVRSGSLNNTGKLYYFVQHIVQSNRFTVSHSEGRIYHLVAVEMNKLYSLVYLNVPLHLY